MKQIGRALGKRLTYANVVATLALFMAMGGTAAAAVLITSNSQVASNTISGHLAPTGKHANLISGSVNATDLASSVKSSIKVHCPAGMQQGGDLCFDVSLRTAVDWQTARSTCANAGLRLPSVGELGEIFNNTGAPQVTHWTDSLFFNPTPEAIELTENSSRQINISASIVTSNVDQYRCVATPTN